MTTDKSFGNRLRALVDFTRPKCIAENTAPPPQLAERTFIKQEEPEDMAKSANNTYVIARRDPRMGKLPAFLELGHKHLEKAGKGSPLAVAAGQHYYTIPVDLLALVMGREYVDQLKEVELVYKHRA